MEPSAVSAVTVSELEGAISDIAGVRAARIVASADGRIEEIHILALPGKSPKQLVRDVESALMAGFGVAIDRRKISIAQIGVAAAPPPPPATEPAPEQHTAVAPEEAVETATTAGKRIRIGKVGTEIDAVRMTVRIQLESDEAEAFGEASGPVGAKIYPRLVAEATLRAVEQLVDVPAGFAIEDCVLTGLGGRQVAVCSVATTTQFGEQALAGSAIVRHTAESAAVRATLDALNRRIGL